MEYRFHTYVVEVDVHALELEVGLASEAKGKKYQTAILISLNSN